MFYGEFKHNLDNKGRLILPSLFRDVAKENYIENFYITRGFEGCLLMFSEQEWRDQESKLKQLSFTKKESRKFSRLYFSAAAKVNVDKQGRFLLPKYLKDFANIQREVIFIGVSNRVEIWSSETWKKYYESEKNSFEDIAETLF